MKVNLNEIQPNDCFSEISHYTFIEKTTGGYRLKHHESGNVIVLAEKYVENLLVTADQYENEVKVGKEDKLWTQKQIDEATKKGGFPTDENGYIIPKVGDLRLKGIRTIWDEIHSAQVFSVCFTKANKELSAKEFNKRKEDQIVDALERIQKVKDSKKGVANAAALILKEIQEKPILPYEKGEERLLRGYKVQFNSLDGRYDCVDLDCPDGVDKPNIRPVNINTILYLVYNGTKYILE